MKITFPNLLATMKAVPLIAAAILLIPSFKHPARPTLRELNPLIYPELRERFLSRFDVPIRAFEAELSMKLKDLDVYLDPGHTEVASESGFHGIPKPWCSPFCCRATAR